MSPSEPTSPTPDRRRFLTSFAGISGSFALGAAGGVAAGAFGKHWYDQKRQNENQVVGGKISYAQQGEDLVIANMCEFLRIERPTYLDIGAYDPIVDSNTYLFYANGSQGVLVDANPARWPRLASVRPRDTLIRGGIGATDGPDTTMPFYVVEGGGAGLSTFSKEEADLIPSKTNGMSRYTRVVDVPVYSINKVLREHFPSAAPNIVSIDVEGLDLPILRVFDFTRYRPDIICVEIIERFRRDIFELMAAKDYELRGGTFVNCIFVDKRHQS